MEHKLGLQVTFGESSGAQVYENLKSGLKPLRSGAEN